MSDLIKRLGWTTSLALSAALLGGCGGEPGDMDGDGLDSNIEVVEPSPAEIPSTGMDPMPAPGLDTEPAPGLGTEPAPGLGTEPTPGLGTEPEIDPAPADPGTEVPAPEQP